MLFKRGVRIFESFHYEVMTFNYNGYTSYCHTISTHTTEHQAQYSVYSSHIQSTMSLDFLRKIYSSREDLHDSAAETRFLYSHAKTLKDQRQKLSLT